MEVCLKRSQLCGFIVAARYFCSAFSLFSISVTIRIEVERRDM